MFLTDADLEEKGNDFVRETCPSRKQFLLANEAILSESPEHLALSCNQIFSIGVRFMYTHYCENDLNHGGMNIMLSLPRHHDHCKLLRFTFWG